MNMRRAHAPPLMTHGNERGICSDPTNEPNFLFRVQEFCSPIANRFSPIPLHHADEHCSTWNIPTEQIGRPRRSP